MHYFYRNRLIYSSFLESLNLPVLSDFQQFDNKLIVGKIKDV